MLQCCVCVAGYHAWVGCLCYRVVFVLQGIMPGSDVCVTGLCLCCRVSCLGRMSVLQCCVCAAGYHAWVGCLCYRVVFVLQGIMPGSYVCVTVLCLCCRVSCLGRMSVLQACVCAAGYHAWVVCLCYRLVFVLQGIMPGSDVI